MNAASPRGFTLIELLVALFITAIMFALGYGAITQALDNRERVRSQQQRLNELQRAVRVLTQDFAQAAPRPVRDAIGTGSEAAFLADPRVTTLLSLTRGGHGNFAGAQRPMLQRVDYLFENQTLVRNAWPVLDRTQSSVPLRRVLLKQVRAVKLRYMDGNREWREQWPPPASSLPQERQLRLRPVAVEISLDTPDFGLITRLVEVPG